MRKEYNGVESDTAQREIQSFDDSSGAVVMGAGVWVIL